MECFTHGLIDKPQNAAFRGVGASVTEQSVWLSFLLWRGWCGGSIKEVFFAARPGRFVALGACFPLSITFLNVCRPAESRPNFSCGLASGFQI